MENDKITLFEPKKLDPKPNSSQDLSRNEQNQPNKPSKFSTTKHLLDKLRYEGVPTGDRLLQREVQFEGGSGRRVTLDGAQSHRPGFAFEIEEEDASPESARFRFRHGHYVPGYPLEESAG